MKKCFSFLMIAVLLMTFISAQATVTLPSGLQVIESGAFENDSSVSGVITIPGNVAAIGDRAFAGTDIYALNLPAACRTIGSDILSGVDAAYIYMTECTALDEATLDSVHYVFVENGVESYPDDKYIPVSSLAVLDGLYYLVAEDGLYPLCPVNPAALSGTVTIPKYDLDYDLPVISLDKLVLPGCEDLKILTPAYMTIPEGMNAESYTSLPMAPITCLPDPPVAGYEAEFTTTVTNNWGDMDYEWDFWYGDETSRSVNTWTTDYLLTITPETEGDLTVSLTVTDALGDTNTETATFYVEPYVEFTLSDLSYGDVYAGSETCFTVTPEGANGDVSYEWSFTHDGISEIFLTSEPSYAYTPAEVGVFTVTVTAADADGRIAEITDTFDAKCSGITLAPPTLDTPLIVGQESNVIIDAQCSCEITSTVWEIESSDYSDAGSGDRISTIPFTPVDAVDYTVFVTVTDAYGNLASCSTVFTASNPPMTVSAPATEDALHVGAAAEFTVEVLCSEGDISYTWIVSGPDGDEAFFTTVPSLTYTPLISGEYTISVTAEDASGQEAVSSEVFTVSALSDAAVSVPYTDSELIAGNAVVFAVDALSDCEIVSYQWSITGSSANEEYTTDEPTLTFTAPVSGDYTVTVTVTDAKGSSATSSDVFSFRCDAISMTSPAAPDSVVAHASAEFTADVSCFCSIAEYSWALEGPETSITYTTDVPSVTITPEKVGEYALTLTVTDASGNTASASCSFTAACSGLVVPDIAADVAPAVGERTTFSIDASCDCDSLSYQWTLVYGENTLTSSDAALVFTPDATGSCTVTVTVTDLAGNSITKSADFNIDTEILYRALLIGNTYPYLTDLDPDDEDDTLVWVDDLSGPDNDIAAMEIMLGLQTETPFDVTGMLNVTASQIQSAITSELGGADSNDISLFYYSGHGTNLGDLCGTENTYISVDELRSYLDTVPGKKIVLLDCCYSGMHIGKSVSAESAEDSFNSAVISAFSASKTRSNLATDTDDYIVLTACNQKQESLSYGVGVDDGVFWFGAFTYALTLGSGYDMIYAETCTPLADYYGNNDGSITLGEAYNDIVDTIVNYMELDQATQYHGDLDFVLWRY